MHAERLVNDMVQDCPIGDQGDNTKNFSWSFKSFHVFAFVQFVVHLVLRVIQIPGVPREQLFLIGGSWDLGLGEASE